MSDVHTPAAEVLRAEGLRRTYRDGSRDLTVLKDVSLQLQGGESLSIVGPSGSGKSTLLGLLAGLDRPSAGEVWIAGCALGSMGAGELAAHRGRYVGFVFQSYRLFPYATALDNVCIPLELRRGLSRVELRQRAEAALESVGLGARLGHRPAQLSGGEQQRVAIARALVTRPALILADEPTGNLDAASGAVVEKLLWSSCREMGVGLVLVTHDIHLAERADRVLSLSDGEVVGLRAGQPA
ncbi:MAG: ABC transporter ATP-binding protein [Planctomycetota bacterium]|nr:MAG: ABC transporter ATP-binding protein [Planctomycetota bacterium]